MRSIWKFPITGPSVTIEMPAGAGILTLQMQGERPCIWAEVDMHAPKEPRHFRIYGTGFILPVTFDVSYIGTCQDSGGFVWHLYEERRP